MWGQLPPLELREEQTCNHPTRRRKCRPHWRACGCSLLDDGFAVVSDWPTRSPQVPDLRVAMGWGRGWCAGSHLLGDGRLKPVHQNLPIEVPVEHMRVSDPRSHSCSGSQSHGGITQETEREVSPLLGPAMSLPGPVLT